MSLYNMLHGYDPMAPVVVAALAVDPSEISRFRDAYFDYRDESKTDPVMIILTRTGGGNREAYDEGNKFLQSLTDYIDDRDDSFDATFALFRYNVPQELRDQVLRYLAKFGKPMTLEEKTYQATGANATERQKNAAREIAEKLQAAIASGEGGSIEI